jgi:hypothetical protein
MGDSSGCECTTPKYLVMSEPRRLPYDPPKFGQLFDVWTGRWNPFTTPHRKSFSIERSTHDPDSLHIDFSNFSAFSTSPFSPAFFAS